MNLLNIHGATMREYEELKAEEQESGVFRWKSLFLGNMQINVHRPRDEVIAE